MADLSGGKNTSDEEARLAAMRRAAQYTNPMEAETGGSAPLSVSPEQTSAIFRANAAANDPTGGSAPMSVSPEQKAALATAGGPPPGFTGTFGGKQYSGGQPVSTTTTTAPGATTPGTGGSLASTLQPPPTTTTTSRPVQLPTGTQDTALSRAATTQPPGKPYDPNDTSTLATTGGGANVGVGARNGVDTTDTGAGSGLENQNEAGPGSQGGSSGSLGALTNQITSMLSGITQSLSSPTASPDVTGVFLQQSKSILAMLDDQEAQLRAENEKAGTTVDPSTQFTIDKLRQNLEENLKTTREDLNRRGLNESGIELALEQKLRSGAADNQTQILAERLSNLRTQLASGLSNIRSQKVSTLGQFGLAASNAQFNAGENSKRDALAREQSALQGMLNLRGQVSSSQDSALARAAAQSQSQAALAQNASQFSAKQAADAQQFGSLSAYQQAQIDQSNQDRSSAMSRAASAASNPTSTINQQRNTASAANDLLNTYSSRQEAQAAIAANAAMLQQNGVDLETLMTVAQRLPNRTGGTTSAAAGAGGAGGSRLQ